MYLIKTPFWLRWLYPPSLTWKKSNSTKTIYITFDDGPIPEVTPYVLSVLDQYHAKATFFCIGDNVRKNPEIFNAILEKGHSTGNHTFNHLNGWKTADEEYLENYKKCAHYVPSNLFRPPYGRIKRSQISGMQSLNPGVDIIMWDVLSGDFDQHLSPEKCLKNVLQNTEPGSIIVFHDSVKAFDRLKFVLPRAMEYWSRKGYKFAPLCKGLNYGVSEI